MWSWSLSVCLSVCLPVSIISACVDLKSVWLPYTGSVQEIVIQHWHEVVEVYLAWSHNWAIALLSRRSHFVWVVQSVNTYVLHAVVYGMSLTMGNPVIMACTETLTYACLSTYCKCVVRFEFAHYEHTRTHVHRLTHTQIQTHMLSTGTSSVTLYNRVMWTHDKLCA